MSEFKLDRFGVWVKVGWLACMARSESEVVTSELTASSCELTETDRNAVRDDGAQDRGVIVTNCGDAVLTSDAERSQLSARL